LNKACNSFKVISVFLFFVFISGCAKTSLDSRVTQAQNLWRWRSLYGEASIANKPMPVGDLQTITNQLVAVSPLKGSPIRTYLVQHKSINAGTDGENIYLHVPLLKLIGGDRNMVAAVIAHELGHLIAHHHPHRKNRQELSKLPTTALSGLNQWGGVASLALREIMQMGSQSYSRKEEKEADIIAAFLCYEAGFDPYALNQFFDATQKTSANVKLPLPTLSSMASGNIQSISQSLLISFLRGSPLYKVHPPSRKRKEVVHLISSVKAGTISYQALKDQNPWAAKLYEILEKRRPKR